MIRMHYRPNFERPVRRPLFRTQLALMAFGLWAFGDHVRDPRAFQMRLARNAWRVPT